MNRSGLARLVATAAQKIVEQRVMDGRVGQQPEEGSEVHIF